MKRIFYFQYSNPASLPPVEHSALIFQRAGYQVALSGIVERNDSKLLTLPSGLLSCGKLWQAQAPGLMQKLHYVCFLLFHFWHIVLKEPGWVYASDVFSCPAVCLIKFFRLGHVIYHEHDSIDDSPRDRTLVERFMLRVRHRAARCADLVILPNYRRAEALDRMRTDLPPSRVVWNCPRLEEVGTARREWTGGVLRVLYHGSIVPERLPLVVLEALARFSGRVRLSVVGYFPDASSNYADTLQSRARELGIESSLEIRGAMPRAQTLAFAARHDVGLALMPTRTCDINMQHMTGASNKAFDYLSAGLGLLVSNLPDWNAFYVEPGYALSCDPDDVESVARALELFLNDAHAMRSMGEKGRRRILSDWNYENQFSSILREVEQSLA